MKRTKTSYFHSLLVNYGVTREELAARLRRQEGHCLICNERPPKKEKGRRARLHVDHNHKTFQVRDLLCSQCNSLLGFAQEDLQTLLAAILYLWRHKNGVPILSRFTLQAQADDLLEVLESIDFDVDVLRKRQFRKFPPDVPFGKVGVVGPDSARPPLNTTEGERI